MFFLFCLKLLFAVIMACFLCRLLLLSIYILLLSYVFLFLLHFNGRCCCLKISLLAGMNDELGELLLLLLLLLASFVVDVCFCFLMCFVLFCFLLLFVFILFCICCLLTLHRISVDKLLLKPLLLDCFCFALKCTFCRFNLCCRERNRS
jgi:hypothetical protein